MKYTEPVGTTIQKRAEVIDWWHSGIDLGHGISTHGRTVPEMTLLPYLALPDDLTGKSVLDVGAWDGFMSFECERRGAAQVVAVDSFAWDCETGKITGFRTGRAGFDLAHQCRQSKVLPVHCDVLDLSPAHLGTFDIVLFLGVLYHMRHPLLALEKVAAMTNDLLIVESYIDMGQVDFPVMRFFPGSELNDDSTNWWGPNKQAIAAMLHSVGFSSVELTGEFGNRASFHARRGQA